MSDRRSRALLVVGLALAVLTAVLLYGALTAGRQQAGAPSPRSEILVARADLAAGTVLASEHLERRSYPSELVPPGALTEPARALGQRLTGPVARGVPIVAASVGDQAGRSAAGLTVESGRVVYAFTSSDPLTQSGLIRPGDHVDVLATVPVGADPRVTQKIVQDLTVMQVAGGTREQPARALIFVVDHQTALVLKHLRDSGALVDLVLRSPAESGPVRTVSVNNAYLVRTFGLTP